MKVLNLGSSGQIGAYLTEYLRKKGHEVIEFDRNRHLGAQILTSDAHPSNLVGESVY